MLNVKRPIMNDILQSSLVFGKKSQIFRKVSSSTLGKLMFKNDNFNKNIYNILRLYISNPRLLEKLVSFFYFSCRNEESCPFASDYRISFWAENNSHNTSRM